VACYRKARVNQGVGRCIQAVQEFHNSLLRRLPMLEPLVHCGRSLLGQCSRLERRHSKFEISLDVRHMQTYN
jgi:hypothetical protein